MWRGLQRLDDITETWRILQQEVELPMHSQRRLAEALRVAMIRGP